MIDSVFNEVGGMVKDWLKNPVNFLFICWYLLPGAGFVLLQLFVIGPALGYPALEILTLKPGSSETWTTLALRTLSLNLVMLFLSPAIAAIVLSSLSSMVLSLYRGRVPWTRAIFRPWLRRNQRRSAKLYGSLPAKRREYRFLVWQGLHLITEDGVERVEEVPEPERSALIDQLRRELQELHENYESLSTENSLSNDTERAASNPLGNDVQEIRTLPIQIERVAPSDLGNALSLAEEYPFERYGIDAAIFWPRLRAELEPEKLESLDRSFALMNGVLNLSLLSYLFALESLIVSALAVTRLFKAAIAPLPIKWLLGAALISLLVGYCAYRVAVGIAYSTGNIMQTLFDYYRGRVLDRFNLKMPDEIDQEFVTWLKLGAFIRRGESFYYPSEFRAKEKQ